ncbi:MAG: hypothetical protein H6666_02495 [Ardenticatenaceae bacterium]|nr:hypothetical protein [Ardenticatenaceae bacterium]
MTAVLNIVIPLVGAMFLLVALVSIVRALQSRSQSTRYTYGVGRQEARRTMQIAVIRSVIFAVIGLILLGVFGLSLRPNDMLPGDEAFTPQPTTTATLVVIPPTATGTPPPTVAIVATEAPLPSPSPTNPLLVPTDLPTATPTSVPSAIVNSEVGLYLREAPGGTQELELLVNGTVLILLPGRETVDGVEWQQVRTPTGNEGWVAVQFIVYQ